MSPKSEYSSFIGIYEIVSDGTKLALAASFIIRLPQISQLTGFSGLKMKPQPSDFKSSEAR